MYPYIYPAYLDYQFSSVPINMPSDLLQVNMGVNYSGVLLTH